jgi:hypothetical protein
MKARNALLAALLLAFCCASFLAGDLAVSDPNALAPDVREPMRSVESLRASCNHPPVLRLVRYEDGSARLVCGEAVLVRVSVPG